MALKIVLYFEGVLKCKYTEDFEKAMEKKSDFCLEKLYKYPKIDVV